MTTARHPLDMQHCDDCGAWWALRPYACGACGGTALRWMRASGAGVVIAHSVVHRAPDASWRARAPYALVLVRMAEGPIMMGHAASDVVMDQAVQGMEWRPDPEGRSLLRFEARRPP